MADSEITFPPPPPDDELVFPVSEEVLVDGSIEIDQHQTEMDEIPAVESAPLASHAEEVVAIAAAMNNISPSKYSNLENQTSIHAFSEAEKTAFVKHINETLQNDPDLKDRIPIDPSSMDIFEQVRDGILLCKLINASVSGTIDESKMIKNFRDEKSKTYHVILNQNLCIDGAKKIGAVVVNLGAEDLIEGKPYLVFGLLWQIIKIGILQEVDIDKHPELAQLKEGEEDLTNLPPEELLLKWFNWHLKNSGVEERIDNFASLTDSTAYIHVMHQLAPESCTLEALNEPNNLKRAEIMLMDAEKLGCRSFVTAQDIVHGNEKLNLVFAANLFNKNIGMGSIAEEMEKENTVLQQQKKELEVQVCELQEEIQYLKLSKENVETHLNDCTDKNNDLEKKMFELKLEKEEFAKKIHLMHEANEKLVEHVKMLDEEKKMLEKAYSEMKTLNEELKNKLSCTSEELQRERISLETSEFCGASLANDLESLRSRQEKLEYLIDHLKIERMKSDMHVERLRILYNSFPTTEALCEAIYKDVTLESISQNASKCGYLTKKARNSNSWKYRYFVLRDNFLFYFKSDKDTAGRFSGVIRVDDAVIKFAENPTKRDLKEQWLLAIEVPNNNDSIAKHSFYISGEDHELEGWKSQIRIAAGWWTKGNRIKLA